MAEKTLNDQSRLGLTLAVFANVVALYGLAAAAPLANRRLDQGR